MPANDQSGQQVIRHQRKPGRSPWRIIVLLMLELAIHRSPAAAETVSLRGYGTVTADFSPQRALFVCESPAKADILFGKLLADLFWDAGDHHMEKTAVVQGGRAGEAKVTVHLYPPYGAIIAARNKNRVLIVGGQDEKEALAAAGRERLFASIDTLFRPSKPYPKYLDFFDLRSAKAYTMGLHPENHYRYQERSDFVKKFFPGGMFFSAADFGYTPAEGVFPGSALLDTDMALAEKEDQMYSISIGTGAWPDWAQNKWPDDVDRQSPLSLFWPDALDSKPESLGLSWQQRQATSMKLMRDVMQRYKDSPSMGGWQLFNGDYIYETYFSKDVHGHFGATPIGLDAFRRWLRDDRGCSLASLGERWYGDAGHFKQWSEVPLPDPFEFYGGIDATCFSIHENWLWKKADAADLDKPADDAPGWMPVAMPPSSMEALALPSAPAFWRTTFDPTSWLAAAGGKDVYLVCNPNNSGWKDYSAWLNGKSLGKFRSTVSPFNGPISMKVNGLLTPGVNNLVLSTPEGDIRGPVFLTTSVPRVYPYLGVQGNARYVDMLEWRLHELNTKVTDAAEYARSIDPDRPFVICATSGEVWDAQGDLLSRMGGSMQDTGYEASYRPFNSRLGYAGGFYGSAERSGIHDIHDPAAFGVSETKTLNWLLFNGEGSYMEWRDPYCYYDVEKQTGLFTKNKRAYELLGKYLPEQPGIAIFRSSRNQLLDPYEGHSMWEWDIGRGELHRAHYDNVYVTETMLARGLANDYPVLFDTDTRIMDQDTIGAIRRYVEQGGTFVALQNSGRHGVLEPDTWPISELTGFKVLSVGKKGKIRFEPNLPLFKRWEGKEFEGEGSALDWKDEESAKDVSLGLKRVAGDTVALAKWEDGTVAVGMRKLGKGRVILLGSTFWRYGRDLGGTGIWRTEDLERSFFERLFTDLGVKHTANASSKDVFARKMVTKNGLQEWLVVMDETGAGAKADVGFATAARPSAMWDMVTGQSVPFDYSDGWVNVRDLQLGPWELRIFAVKRATMVGGVDTWWREKTKFWRASNPATALPKMAPERPAVPAVIAFQTWQFMADKDNSAAASDQWLQASFHDSAWRKSGNEAWNFKFPDLKDYSGVGLYRSSTFDIPAKWAGKRITLNANGYVRHMGYCFKHADLFINGKRIEGIPRPYSFLQADITDELKPKGNILCIKIVGREPSGDYPLSGLLDCTVWIQPEIQLQNVISLAGDWQGVMGGWSKSQTVTLPGTASGHHFVREVDIPAAWQGQNVYLHLKNSPPNRAPKHGMENGLVMINGQPISAFWFIHKAYALNDNINLTPYLKFGARNRIELWPQFGQKDPGKDYEFEVDGIEVGCEAK